MESINSLSRVVQIMLRLLDGEELSVQELCATYEKHAETIKKDIATIRNELMHKPVEIQYSRSKKSYKLVGLDDMSAGNTFSSALAVLMVMYGCRALSADEVQQVENFIVRSFTPQLQQRLKKFASSFRFHYKPILNKPLFEFIETAFQCIIRQQTMRVTYTTIYNVSQQYDIRPYTLIFDEGYFYLIAEPMGVKRVEGNIFRIDQFDKYEVLDDQFAVQQHGNDYFKPGEFANHSFFMHYGASTTVIRLKMQPFIESYFVAKFPVHQLIDRGEEWLVYECTVSHGESALFWIFSERHWVEVLSPLWLREKVKYFLMEMMEMYKD
ncbi:YafY family protein [Paenibacillus sp. N3.4]|uniref:helix-turn-helix transcriptional regulator n=1 Tax=Paenibacillus sp. N3.4 TaxID=2603222 RepID=UPI0011CA85F9|nr:WYL domain-containing protein [Paenibacillus sp. N3.4]TXK85121.1 WYL domain-containing protein [Paenibacillus sp. N3.4]